MMAHAAEKSINHVLNELTFSRETRVQCRFIERNMIAIVWVVEIIPLMQKETRV